MNNFVLTHSLKLINPKSSTSGVCIDTKPNHKPSLAYLFGSGVKTDRPYFGGASNAADFKVAKELAAKANEDGFAEPFFPSDVLGQWTPQMYMKRGDSWILHTPTTSLALIYELTKRLRAIYETGVRAPIASWVFEPNSAALANRGELAAHLKGRSKLMLQLRREEFAPHNKRSWTNDLDGEFIVIKGLLSQFNANSGYITYGLPAMTAIGGFLEKMALNLGIETPSFAVGYRDWFQYPAAIPAKKGPATDRKTLASKRNAIQLSTGESPNTTSFCLVFKKPENVTSNLIMDWLSRNRRMAGGTISGDKLSVVNSGELDALVERFHFLEPLMYVYTDLKQREKLDRAIQLLCDKNIFPVANGFRLLEKPKVRKNVRDKNCLHAYSESTWIGCQFVICSQFNSHLFWHEDRRKSGHYWSSKEVNNT